MTTMMFENRNVAGKMLAEKLSKFDKNSKAIVLGLPRGGVVLAHEVAEKLSLPLDIIVTRKIGAPFEKELAIGAIAEDAKDILNKELIKMYKITQKYIDSTIKQETEELKRRLDKYRQGRGVLDLKNKIAIIVDDGVATGYTMMTAIMSARAKGAQKIVVATPVIASDTSKEIAKKADELIYLDKPVFFGAVGAFYREFDQVEDEEVISIMKRHNFVLK